MGKPTLFEEMLDDKHRVTVTKIGKRWCTQVRYRGFPIWTSLFDDWPDALDAALEKVTQ